MKARPTARILLTIRNRTWTVHEALAELIDNAFGGQRGNAPSVWIDWSPKTRILTLLDNGAGMRDVLDLFTLGKGATSGPGDIGLYGVGGSEALLWLADYADVTTLHDGRVAHGKAHWAQCIEREEFPEINNRWRAATVTSCPTGLLEQQHGTLICLYIRKGLRVVPEQVLERLSRLFAVALRSGRDITWSTADPQMTIQQLHAWNPGTLEDVIRATVTLENGLGADVMAGRVDHLSIANSKLAVNYVYRQIKETTAGFGRPIQGACGYIDLSDEWLRYLTTTKNDINEDGREYEEALMATVADVLKPLVEQLAKAKRTKVFSNIKINLKQKFNHGFKAHLESQDDRPDLLPDSPETPGAEPRESPRRARLRRPPLRAAVIDIEDATNEGLGGLLCTAAIEGNIIKAFVNTEHPLIITALEAEPVNRMLLEQVLVAALAREIVESDALVSIGLLSDRHAKALYDRYEGNAWDVFSYVMRLLTDGVESMANETIPALTPVR